MKESDITTKGQLSSHMKSMRDWENASEEEKEKYREKSRKHYVKNKEKYQERTKMIRAAAKKYLEEHPE